MKRRILLVDDELTILLTLKVVLESQGFEVETAASAREAKTKIRNNTYHMVMTDMRMESNESGLEVIRAAKEASYQARSGTTHRLSHGRLRLGRRRRRRNARQAHEYTRSAAAD